MTTLNFWQSPGSLAPGTAVAWQLSNATIEQITRHEGPVFSLVGGASYGVLGMLVHPRPWDFIPPDAERVKISAGCELIPFDAVKATLMALMEEYRPLIGQISRYARHRVYQLEPPPPSADGALITPHMYWSLYPGMQQMVAPAVLRMKLWSLQSQILREQCANLGIEFLPHPALAAEDSGFLKDDYFFDGAHANSAYGALVLDQIREIHAASV